MFKFPVTGMITLVPSKVKFDWPMAALDPFAVRIFEEPVAPVIVVNPDPAGPVGPCPLMDLNDDPFQ